MEGEAEKVTEEEEFEFRARLEAEQGAGGGGGRQIVEPNALQRRAGIRRNRYKDDNLAGNIGSGFLNMGEDAGRGATLMATNLGMPPNVANAAGFLGDIGSSLLTLPIGGATAKVPTEAGSRWLGRDLMQRTLKPSKAARESGDAEKAVTTLLREPGARVTEGGVANLTRGIDELDSQLDALIANSKARVSTETAIKPALTEAVDKFKYGLDQAENKSQIMAQVQKFLDHPEVQGALDISVQQAQKMKRGIYTELGDRGFVMGNKPEAVKEAKKAIARGLNTGISDVVPGAKETNTRMAELINARNLAQERVLQAGNNQAMGLGFLAQPEMWAPWLIERNPLAMSFLSRTLYRNQPAGIAGQVGTGFGNLMSRDDQ